MGSQIVLESEPAGGKAVGLPIPYFSPQFSRECGAVTMETRRGKRREPVGSASRADPPGN